MIRPITVVSSANLMMVFELCLAMQSWVNREYRRGLRTHPWGAPVLRISMADVSSGTADVLMHASVLLASK